MADISMCTGILRKDAVGVEKEDQVCPLRDKCYRFTAKASKIQSYIYTPGYYKKKNKKKEFVCNLKWIENDN